MNERIRKTEVMLKNALESTKTNLTVAQKELGNQRILNAGYNKVYRKSART